MAPCVQEPAGTSACWSIFLSNMAECSVVNSAARWHKALVTLLIPHIEMRSVRGQLLSSLHHSERQREERSPNYMSVILSLALKKKKKVRENGFREPGKRQRNEFWTRQLERREEKLRDARYRWEKRN